MTIKVFVLQLEAFQFPNIHENVAKCDKAMTFKLNKLLKKVA